MGRDILKTPRNRIGPGSPALFPRAFFMLAAAALVFAAPASATFKKEAPNSCIDCHKGLEDARLREPVALWSASVHAEVGNTCDGCHGGNPADTAKSSMAKENNFYAAPKKNEIVQFCGKCHKELSENFMKSEHGTTGEQTCIGCHGSHTIRRISIDIINEEKCSECHDYDEAEKLKNILQGLHGKFQESKSKAKRITGLPTEPLNKELDKVWTKLRQVRMISHTFDIPKVETFAQKTGESIDQVDIEITRLLDVVRERKIWGYAAVALFALLALSSYFYNKSDSDQR